jgi:RNA polymerase sigma-70 factor (ECF subfamily)
VQLPNNSAGIGLLYQNHAGALLIFALAIAGDRAMAQDAVHQVFLKMLESPNPNDIANIKAYLFASVRNAVLNDAKTRRRNVAIDEESPWFDPPLRDHAAELNLRRALHSLPEDQRQVVVLHVWGELTFLQIGEILDISSNTAASRYRYAFAKLRDAVCPKENSCAHPS